MSITKERLAELRRRIDVGEFGPTTLFDVEHAVELLNACTELLEENERLRAAEATRQAWAEAEWAPSVPESDE